VARTDDRVSPSLLLDEETILGLVFPSLPAAALPARRPHDRRM